MPPKLARVQPVAFGLSVNNVCLMHRYHESESDLDVFHALSFFLCQFRRYAFVVVWFIGV